jgi:hypothetical protein
VGGDLRRCLPHNAIFTSMSAARSEFCDLPSTTTIHILPCQKSINRQIRSSDNSRHHCSELLTMPWTQTYQCIDCAFEKRWQTIRGRNLIYFKSHHPNGSDCVVVIDRLLQKQSTGMAQWSVSTPV